MSGLNNPNGPQSPFHNSNNAAPSAGASGAPSGEPNPAAGPLGSYIAGGYNMPPGAHAPPVGPGQYPPPDMAARIAAIQARAHHVSQSSDAAAAVMAAQHQAAHSVYGPPIVSTNQPSAMASAPTAGGSSSRSSKPRYKKRTKKYNNFNIFFMLERQLLLQSRGGGIDAVKSPIDVSNAPLTKHKELHLPPLCRRYNHLPLTANWFLELLANQNKKRPHRKSHGLIPFKELAQTVAKNYREIDEETQEFVNEVAERLGWQDQAGFEQTDARWAHEF